jgi:hypothetical protein
MVGAVWAMRPWNRRSATGDRDATGADARSFSSLVEVEEDGHSRIGPFVNVAVPYAQDLSFPGTDRELPRSSGTLFGTASTLLSSLIW